MPYTLPAKLPKGHFSAGGMFIFRNTTFACYLGAEPDWLRLNIGWAPWFICTTPDPLLLITVTGPTHVTFKRRRERVGHVVITVLGAVL